MGTEVADRETRASRRTPATAEKPAQRTRRNVATSALALDDAIAQAKLTVGPADDPFEREADDVADRVVRSLRNDTSAPARADTGHDIDGELPSETEPTPPLAQRVQRATAVGEAGGALDAATAARIQSSRGGGRALPDEARSKMESAFGADFGSIRVHEGSGAAALNDSIQAQAFTVGNDVFFRDGLPDTKSSAGQHLLAHELTHTIQQGATAVHRFSDSPAGRVRRATPVVQRRFTGVAATPITVYGLSGENVGTSAAGTVVLADRSITVDEDPANMKFGETEPQAVDDPKNWVRVLGGTDMAGQSIRGMWVKLSLLTDTDAGDAFDDGAEDAEMALEVVGFAGEIGGAKKGADRFLDSGDDMVGGDSSSGLSHAADGAAVAGMFLTLAQSIKTFRDTEASGWDKAEGAIDAIGALGSGAGAGASMAKTGMDAQQGSAAFDAAGGLAMFGDIFEGIKATFTIVKKAVELAKEADQKTDQEKFHDSMEIVSSLIQAAASGVSAAKNFLDTFATGAGAAMGAAVPGFGIALGAADLVVRSVDLVSGLVQKSRMRTDKQGHKEGLVIPKFGAYGGETGKKGKAVKSLKQYKSLSKKADNGALDQDEENFLEWCDKSDAFQSYLFSKGLQYINQKRANRALLKISVSMMKISGDVAVLGGASAPVGVGLKAGALALDVGASVFRKFKQYFRDKRAKKEAKGEEITGALTLFNSEKSSGRKLQEYNKMVDRVFDMITVASQSNSMAMPVGQTNPRYTMVLKYLAAFGIAQGKVKKYADDHDIAGLRAELIEYLQKRE